MMEKRKKLLSAIDVPTEESPDKDEMSHFDILVHDLLTSLTDDSVQTIFDALGDGDNARLDSDHGDGHEMTIVFEEDEDAELIATAMAHR